MFIWAEGRRGNYCLGRWRNSSIVASDKRGSYFGMNERQCYFGQEEEGQLFIKGR